MTETTATFTAGFDRYVCHGDTTTAEHDGWTFAAEVHRDDSFGAPWLEHDGHGEVTDWTTRDKAPGELVLCSDRGSKRYYDFAGACALALRDGWNCPPYEIEGETPRQKAARAARHNFEVLRAWCNDEWFWCGIVVTVSRDGIELGSASLWGIESDCTDYHEEVINELIQECLDQITATIGV